MKSYAFGFRNLKPSPFISLGRNSIPALVVSAFSTAATVLMRESTFPVPQRGNSIERNDCFVRRCCLIAVFLALTHEPKNEE
jgi:hypothetical protein